MTRWRPVTLLVLLLALASPAAAMKLNILQGTTCSNTSPRTCLVDVFIQDSSSTTGAGLTGLTSLTAGLVCYAARSDQGNAGLTQVTLSAGTLGTWTPGGFKEKDATNGPGLYEFGIPTTVLAAGSNFATIYCKGATNMAPLVLEIALVNYDPQDAVTLGLSAVKSNTIQWSGSAVAAPNVAGTPLVDLNLWEGVSPNALLSGRVSGGGTIRKNIGSQTYPVFMALSSDHLTAGAGKTVSVTVAKDLGAPGAITGSVAEIGSGWYMISLSQADTNCSVCTFVATASGCDARRFYFLTGP